MIKIKYNGIKIKTDNIDEAVAILESLKGHPSHIPIPPDPTIRTNEHGDWITTNTPGTLITDHTTLDNNLSITNTYVGIGSVK